jgi:transposase
VNERERDKNAARRLAILRHAEEVTGNVALTCRYYGITRQAFYLWRRRYEAGGLEALRDRSKRPQSCPHETSTEIVGKIIYLRQNYHFGPTKIAMYLKRYHDVQISDSGVWRILKRLGMNRLPASQRCKPKDRRWKRYEKQLPGHHVQIDVKFIAPITPATPGPGTALASSTGAPGARRKKYYQYTAIDDCTRLRVLRIYDKNNQKTAIAFADYVIARLPFQVETIQTDMAWSIRPACPAARVAATASRPSCAAWASPRRTAAPAIPRPRARWRDSSRR